MPMQPMRRVSIVTCVASAIVLLLTACRQGEETHARPPHMLYELHSSDPGLGPASTNSAIIRGHLPAGDLRSIAVVVGRIPGISHEIKSISAVWDEAPVAAKVRVADYTLYLVRSHERGWEISTAGLTSSDSWSDSESRTNGQ